MPEAEKVRYIATCFSHYGAIRMKKLCEEHQMQAALMPVPRFLSSSCGICVRYEGSRMCPVEEVPEEVERIYEKNGEREQDWTCVYEAEGL